MTATATNDRLKHTQQGSRSTTGKSISARTEVYKLASSCLVTACVESFQQTYKITYYSYLDRELKLTRQHQFERGTTHEKDIQRSTACSATRLATHTSFVVPR